MALEVSLIASASRIQAQSDQRTELARERQREEAVQRTREAERLAEERRRADATAADIDRARTQRQYVRSIADADLIQAEIALATEDARIDERLAREQDDLEQFYADERFRTADRAAADNALAPLSPTAPPPPALEETTAASSTPQLTFDDLLAGRNARLAERTEENRQFLEVQNRDFSRSVRSIEELQNNPTAFPVEPPRGSVVDFSA